MNLFHSRASRAFAAPVSDELDSGLQATLQQAYAVEGASPALRQRIVEMAALHEQQTVMQRPRRSLRYLAIAFGIMAGLFCFICWFSLCIRFYTIPSEAMEPTLMGHDAGRGNAGSIYTDAVHDCVIVNKWAYRWNTPQYGDIVVLLAPKEADAEPEFAGIQQERVLVKRIIGLPGDTIEINSGHVYRNGEVLKEPYLAEPMDPNLEQQFRYATRWRNGPLRLKPWNHEYWVMGDNRNDSNDSRYWGVLEESRIIGKVTRIIAPLNRWRSLP